MSHQSRFHNKVALKLPCHLSQGSRHSWHQVWLGNLELSSPIISMSYGARLVHNWLDGAQALLCLGAQDESFDPVAILTCPIAVFAVFTTLIMRLELLRIRVLSKPPAPGGFPARNKLVICSLRWPRVASESGPLCARNTAELL